MLLRAGVAIVGSALFGAGLALWLEPGVEVEAGAPCEEALRRVQAETAEVRSQIEAVKRRQQERAAPESP